MTRSTTIIDTNRDTTPGTQADPRGAGGDDRQDRALLRRYSKDGDVDALSELLLRHAGAAYRLACHFSANSHDAEDSVQVMALEIMKSAEHFDVKRAGSVRLWIMGVVVNVCRRKRVENSRRAAREEKVSGLRPAVVESPVEASVDEAHLKQKIQRAVGALPGLYRTPVSLHYYDGLSSGEIATVLRIPENTIRSQLKRGIEQLREMLLGAGTTLSVVELAKLAASTQLENTRQELLSSLEQIARTGVLPGQAGKTKVARGAKRKPNASIQSKITVGVAVIAALLLLLLIAFKSSFITGLGGGASSSNAPVASSTDQNRSNNSDRILPKGASTPDAAQAQSQQPRAVTETNPDLTKLKTKPDTKIEENLKMTARLKKGVATVALTAISWMAGVRAADAAKAPAAAPASAAAVPQLVDPGSADVTGYVAIPDFTQMLDHLDVVARAFNPQLPAGMLKMQLGMMSGDPALANLDASKPLVVMALKRAASAQDQTPSAAIFIPAKGTSPYDQVIEKAHLVSAFQDGLLICAETPEELKAAQAQLPAYKRIAADKGSADFRCYSSNKSLLAALKPKIQAGLESMTQTTDAAANTQSLPGEKESFTSAILKLEMKTILELLNEIDSQQVDLSFKADTLTIDAIANAVKESALASLFVAPADTTNKMHGLLVSPGVMQAIIKSAPGSGAVFAQKLMETLSKDPDCAAVLTPDVKNYYYKYAAMSGGEWAMSTQLSAEAKTNNQMALTVKDAKSVDETYALMAEMMKPEGIFGKITTGAGMKMDLTFKKSVRQYKGVSISSLKQNMDPSHAAGSMNMVSAFAVNMEFAVVDNKVLVGAREPKDLNQMIDRAQAKEPPAPTVTLESMTVFGPGKQIYFDYNVIELMKEAMQAIPGNPVALVLKDLSAAKPIIGAGLCDHGRAFLQVRVPLTPFIELTTLMQKANAAAAKPAVKDGASGEKTDSKPESKEEKF